jgi:hypothetical protein
MLKLSRLGFLALLALLGQTSTTESLNTARDGYNSALRAVDGAKANNVNLQGRASKIAISGLSIALLGQTAADYTSIAQTILQLMMIAIPIFVVIAVVRMIFRHLRD